MSKLRSCFFEQRDAKICQMYKEGVGVLDLSIIFILDAGSIGKILYNGGLRGKFERLRYVNVHF